MVKYPLDGRSAHGQKFKWPNIPTALLQNMEMMIVSDSLGAQKKNCTADTWLSREFRGGRLWHENFQRRDTRNMTASKIKIGTCSLSFERPLNRVRGAWMTMISDVTRARRSLVIKGGLSDKEYEFQKRFNGWWKCDPVRGDKNTELADTMELGWLMRKGLDRVDRLHVSCACSYCRQ